MIFFAVLGALGIIATLAIYFLVVPAIQRAEELTPEEQEIVDLFAQMHEEDTGGLLALPVYDTTVQIAAVDRRAAVRTLTVSHDEYEAARAYAIERYGEIPPSLQHVADMGGRFGLPTETPPVRQVQPMQRAGRPSPGAEDLPCNVREDSPAAAEPIPPGPAAAGPPDAPVPVSEPSGATGPAPAADVDGDESPWEHETSWFSLDAILADADARAGAE